MHKVAVIPSAVKCPIENRFEMNENIKLMVSHFSLNLRMCNLVLTRHSFLCNFFHKFINLNLNLHQHEVEVATSTARSNSTTTRS